MNGDLTHASFFSGVGGLDMGLERAGWRTVSFSEIDPYASAVLAQRWPGVPNLGDIVRLASGSGRGPDAGDGVLSAARHQPDGWHHATLWTGGFPCQDLSVAGSVINGQRRGLAGSRSGLAFPFLELVGRHRPRFVLLENVPGLLSSHRGHDFGVLLDTMVQLGYGVAWRLLDARFFGVPQRRRRVFILGDSLGGRPGAERAAEVLSVGSRCRRHPPTGVEAGEGATARPVGGVDIARPVVRTSGKHHDEDIDTLIPSISPSPDPRRVREADGLARGSHDHDGVADTLRVGGRASGAGDSYDNTPWVAVASGRLAPSLRAQGNASHREDSEAYAVGSGSMTDDPLLPLGLDSHRYRCCGNGVVSDVAEWIGLRLAALV